MLDRLIHRYASGALAVPARRVATAGVRAQPLALTGLALGFLAVPFIAHSAYLVGLGLVVLSRLLGVLADGVARQVPGRAPDDFLTRVLTLIWSASVPFAFALADPERALAAMFLMLGLVARMAADTDDTRITPGTGTEAVGGDSVGEAELSTIYAALCVFPHWFSVVAYALGIACFVMTGIRVANRRSQQS